MSSATKEVLDEFGYFDLQLRGDVEMKARHFDFVLKTHTELYIYTHTYMYMLKMLISGMYKIFFRFYLMVIDVMQTELKHQGHP